MKEQTEVGIHNFMSIPGSIIPGIPPLDPNEAIPNVILPRFKKNVEDFHKYCFLPRKPISRENLQRLFDAIDNLCDYDISSSFDERRDLNNMYKMTKAAYDDLSQTDWHYKIRDADDFSYASKLKGRRCIIEVASDTFRDTVILPVHCLNTVIAIDTVVAHITRHTTSIWHGQEKQIKAFYDRNKDCFFWCRDIKKCGLTFSQELLTEVLKHLHEKLPQIEVLKYFDFYDHFEVYDPDTNQTYTTERGYGLGMANNLASLILSALNLLLTEDLDYKVCDTLVFNDDSIVAIKGNLTSADYLLIHEAEDRLLSSFDLLLNAKKSYLGFEGVFCEHYSNDSHNIKENKLVCALSKCFLVPYTFLAKMLMNACLNNFHYELSENVLNEISDIISFHDYDWYPTEYQLPYELGGWYSWGIGPYSDILNFIENMDKEQIVHSVRYLLAQKDLDLGVPSRYKSGEIPTNPIFLGEDIEFFVQNFPELIQSALGLKRLGDFNERYANNLMKYNHKIEISYKKYFKKAVDPSFLNRDWIRQEILKKPRLLLPKILKEDLSKEYPEVDNLFLYNRECSLDGLEAALKLSRGSCEGEINTLRQELRGFENGIILYHCLIPSDRVLTELSAFDPNPIYLFNYIFDRFGVKIYEVERIPEWETRWNSLITGIRLDDADWYCLKNFDFYFSPEVMEELGIEEEVNKEKGKEEISQSEEFLFQEVDLAASYWKKEEAGKRRLEILEGKVEPKFNFTSNIATSNIKEAEKIPLEEEILSKSDDEDKNQQVEEYEVPEEKEFVLEEKKDEEKEIPKVDPFLNFGKFICMSNHENELNFNPGCQLCLKQRYGRELEELRINNGDPILIQKYEEWFKDVEEHPIKPEEEKYENITHVSNNFQINETYEPLWNGTEVCDRNHKDIPDEDILEGHLDKNCKYCSYLHNVRINRHVISKGYNDLNEAARHRKDEILDWMAEHKSDDPEKIEDDDEGGMEDFF
jgi:hypothetical protein